MLAFFAVPARAGTVTNVVADLLANLALLIIKLVGKLLFVLIEILLVIVKYNDFINAPAVQKGWILVRDVSNMAFLLIFIAIAFATILGVERYEWKRLLPKLLIMSVVINFSKTICGIIIDASQVVMMTFVNGFKDIAAGNLIRGFGVSDMLSLDAIGEGTVTTSEIAAASVLAAVLLIIATVTVGVIVVMFLLRIIFLWILIVLSPGAFMLSAAPGGESQFQKWWTIFIKYVFVGPILAFFLWLSFSIMATTSPESNIATESGVFVEPSERGITDTSGNIAAAMSGISQSDQLLSYFISIALLLLSLNIANSMGTAGGSMAGTAFAKIKSGGIKLAKYGALAAATGGLGALVGYGAHKAAKKTGLYKTIGKGIDNRLGSGVVKTAGAVIKTSGKILGSERLTKMGTKMREEGGTIRGWNEARKSAKARKDSIAEARKKGAMVDAMNALYLNKITNEASIAENKIILERVKTLKELDLDTNALKDILETGDVYDQKAALQILAEKGSFGDRVAESEETHIKAIQETKEATERLEQEKVAKEAKLAAGRASGSLTQAQQDVLEKEIVQLELDIRENKEQIDEMAQPLIVGMDDLQHRWIYVREKFGDTKSTAQFYSTVTAISRRNGEPNVHGSIKYNAKTGEYKARDFATPEGRRNQRSASSGRGQYQDATETWKADGSVFRDTIKVKNPKTGEIEDVLSDFTDSGREQLRRMNGPNSTRMIQLQPRASFFKMLKADSNSFSEQLAAAKNSSERSVIKANFRTIMEKGYDEIVRTGELDKETLRLIKTKMDKILG